MLILLDRADNFLIVITRYNSIVTKVFNIFATVQINQQSRKYQCHLN